jgi:hypothetical protein
VTDSDQDAPDLEGLVESLETGQSRILSRLDELLGRGHAAAEEHEEKRLGRPEEVREQVRLELEREKAEAAEQAKKDGEKAERQTMAQQLAEMRAKLTETPPVQPQPRRQRVMWGK